MDFLDIRSDCEVGPVAAIIVEHGAGILLPAILGAPQSPGSWSTNGFNSPEGRLRGGPGLAWGPMCHSALFFASGRED